MRRFEGWEPTTTYEYDGDRLVSSTPESEWDEQQQGWMLALAEYQATRCAGCGHDIRETTAMEGTYRWRVSRKRCLACDELAAAQHADEKPRPEAVHWRVEKVR